MCWYADIRRNFLNLASIFFRSYFQHISYGTHCCSILKSQFSLGTLFAYGQTASGKTHTIMGDNKEMGILPLAIADVFNNTNEVNSFGRFLFLRKIIQTLCNYELPYEILSTLCKNKSSFSPVIFLLRENKKGMFHTS